jgi:hypothetical protein
LQGAEPENILLALQSRYYPAARGEAKRLFESEPLMEEQVGTFDAVDERGHHHTIHIYETSKEASGPDGTGGKKVLRTARGEQVTRRAKGKYVIHHAGEINVTSDDPNAP